MKHLKALNKYFWKYRVRLGIGGLFIIISNYFGVLSPQVTGFVIDHVQKNLPGYQPKKHPPDYDMLVQRFGNWIGVNYSGNINVGKVVIICGITILI
ncbi:MAG: ABC transporter, partial [Chitinophagaceae bacterium]